VRLDEVVLRALEKEPQRRYQQASQVNTALETIASQPSQPPSSLSRTPAASGSPVHPSECENITPDAGVGSAGLPPEAQPVKSELRFVGFVQVVLGVGGLLGIYPANWLGNRLQLTFWGPEIGSFLRSLLIFPLVFSQVTGMLALVSVWNLRQCRGYTLALTAIYEIL
jgi:hypothetical protein